VYYFGKTHKFKTFLSLRVLMSCTSCSTARSHTRNAGFVAHVGYMCAVNQGRCEQAPFGGGGGGGGGGVRKKNLADNIPG
jgi:hypothetical protein